MRGQARRVIVDALAARYGGTAHSAVEIARELARDAAIQEVLVVARRGSTVALELPSEAELRLVELPRDGALELPRRLVWETLGLAQLARQSPASVLTLSGMLPRPVPARVTCYVSNALMFGRTGLADRLRGWALRRTAQKKGVALVVPSRSMAALVARVARTPDAVVPLGVDPERFYPAPGSGREVLSVGDFYRHKRHDVVLDAWAALPEPRPTLRLIGDPGVDEANYRLIRARADRYQALGNIVFASRLPHSEMLAPYHAARVLVLASECESFAMPLLEAQASGVPAIVRDIPVLRETGGHGTTYVTGCSVAAWRTELSRLLDDEAAHARARERSLAHAKNFTWTRTARELKPHLLGEVEG
jgi:glycosyltransferase involved in cell wall biosynthesis